MANIFTTMVLGNGQLPATIGDLYTVPGATTAVIKAITVVNTDSVTRTINLYILKSGGTARRIVPKDLNLGAGESMHLDEVITLGAGDKIQGDSSSALVCDYTISGVQET